jgi:glucan phosphorylase
MTDAEIIKALECCSREAYDCVACPLNLKEEEFCFIDVRKYALDLINRQKAKIEELSEVLSKLVDGTFKNGDGACFNDLYDSLLYSDVYFILGDFRSYVQAHERIVEMYKDELKWAKCALTNIACCGKFSSDRTIEDYVRDIWKLKRIYDTIDTE